MGKRKKKVVIDKEKSDLYSKARIGLGKKGFDFKDKYNGQIPFSKICVFRQNRFL